MPREMLVASFFRWSRMEARCRSWPLVSRSRAFERPASPASCISIERACLLRCLVAAGPCLLMWHAALPMPTSPPAKVPELTCRLPSRVQVYSGAVLLEKCRARRGPWKPETALRAVHFPSMHSRYSHSSCGFSAVIARRLQMVAPPLA